MKYSNLFTKTSKDIPADEVSKNAQLLIRAGFVDKTMAGVYALLPLGLRTLNKIENIIRDEMKAVGSQEILMNSLQPKKFWTDTKRWENVDILFKVKSQTENEYAIACSHEEQVTPLVKKMVTSFKDLPEAKINLGYFDVSKEGVPFSKTRKTTHLIIYNPTIQKYLFINNRESYSASEYDFYPIGGGVEDSESFFEAGFRELEEEAGIIKSEIIFTKYLGQVEQKFYVRTIPGFDETNKHLISNILYMETNSTKGGFCDPSKITEKEYSIWLTKDEVQSLLPGFKEVFNIHKNLIDQENTNYLNKITPALSTYQIQTKFRDELRAKSGLLRGREFRMKDMYDFHQNQESLDASYEIAKDAYARVYKKIGLEVYPTEASGGIFTTNPSHEYQAICKAGEDKIYKVPSLGSFFNEEMAPVKAKPFGDSNEVEKPREDILAEGVVGVEALCELFNLTPEKTTKTLFYEEIKTGKMIAAVVRGDYKLNEEKLAKMVGSHIRLASEELVKKTTGAGIGYAGLIDLPKDIEVYIDESLEGLKNFEMGVNKQGYHSINVNFGRDFDTPAKYYDIKIIKQGDLYPETNEAYEIYISAEVGNIFKLGTKYSDAIDFRFVDKDNQSKPVIMGCYGIGTTRCMAVIAEIHNDEKGLKWPKSVAPFTYHLITHINKKDDLETNQKIIDLANKIYTGDFELEKDLKIEKDEVFWDDRDGIGMGQKFGDADLIGCPFQIVISKRSLENGGVEIKDRATGESMVLKY
jgi:prolyl-tRNA synthetase